MRNLRRMEQFFSSQREMDELQKVDLQKPTACRYQNVGAKVHTSLRELRTIENKTVGLKDSSTSKLSDNREKKQQLPFIASKSTNNLLNSSNKNIKIKPQVELKRGKTEKLVKNRDIDRRIMKEQKTEELTCVEEVVCVPELQYKSRGIQTLEDNDLENLYDEGVVR